MDNRRHLVSTVGVSSSSPSPAEIVRAFDPARLTQARQLASLTKRGLADRIGISPTAIGQYETGSSRPRPDHIPHLAKTLDVPTSFFLAGRPHANLDTSAAHFRSLRSTRAYQRAKAAALVEQVWELTHLLETYIQLPWVDLPGFTGKTARASEELPREPTLAARALRINWNLGTGPIRHLVRQIEAHGIVVVTPSADPDVETVDAFSTSYLPRPIIVLTKNRTDDIYRHRFTAAHELGHLVLHSDGAPGDAQQEREANAFAAEFLTPRSSILPHLPARADLRKLVELQEIWGVSVHSLVYRCREVGLLSDSAASRAYKRLNALRGQPGFRPEPIAGYPGEQPALLARSVNLASSETGLTSAAIASELAWPVARLRQFIGSPEERPTLTLLG